MRRLQKRVCLKVVLPTYNGYGLPGKAQSPPDANIFTPAAGRPEADKIFHAKEHHKDDFLIDETDRVTQRQGNQMCEFVPILAKK